MLLDHRCPREPFHAASCGSSSIEVRHTATNEYPFLIGKSGISVMPVTSMELNHKGSVAAHFDGHPPAWTKCLGGGRVSIAAAAFSSAVRLAPAKPAWLAHFIDAACRRGERCLYLCVRGIREPDRPQYAFHRHRTGTVDPARFVADPRLSADVIWSGDAPGTRCMTRSSEFHPPWSWSIPSATST